MCMDLKSKNVLNSARILDLITLIDGPSKIMDEPRGRLKGKV